MKGKERTGNNPKFLLKGALRIDVLEYIPIKVRSLFYPSDSHELYSDIKIYSLFKCVKQPFDCLRCKLDKTIRIKNDKINAKRKSHTGK